MSHSEETSASWHALRERVAATIDASGSAWSAFFDRQHEVSTDGLEILSLPLGACALAGVEGAGFGPGCTLHLSAAAATKVKSQSARLQIRRMGASAEINDVHIYVGDFSNKLTIVVGSSGSVFCGDLGAVVLEISLGHDGTLVVGDKTTVNGAKVVAINGRVLIKHGAMIADEVLIQGSDQHGIVDLATGNFVNHDKRYVHVGRHAWIGRRVTLLPGVAIGDGAIVGACSVVTKDVPSCCVAAGVPARVVREHVSWSRTWDALDSEALAFMDEIKAPFRSQPE